MIFLSLKCFTNVYGIIDCIFKNISIRIRGGVIWVSVGIQWEGHSKHTCAYDGGEGVKLWPLWCKLIN